MTPVVPVGTGSAQLMAQHSFASAVRGVSSRAMAALQQSIMPESCIAECIGKPATALPPTPAIRTKHVSHFIIANQDYREDMSGLSRRARQVDHLLTLGARCGLFDNPARCE